MKTIWKNILQYKDRAATHYQVASQTHLPWVTGTIQHMKGTTTWPWAMLFFTPLDVVPVMSAKPEPGPLCWELCLFWSAVNTADNSFCGNDRVLHEWKHQLLVITMHAIIYFGRVQHSQHRIARSKSRAQAYTISDDYHIIMAASS